MKQYDIVGLGACGVDLSTKVKRFAENNLKVTSHNLNLTESGVTANNCIQAARLGLKTLWCGALGEDDAAKHLIDIFTQEKVEVAAQFLDKTQQSWCIIDETGERQIYVFPNASLKLTPQMVEEEFAARIQASKHFHTEAAVIPLAAAIRGAQIARACGSKVFVDIAGEIDYLLSVPKIGTLQEIKQLISLANVLKLSEAAGKQLSGNKTTSLILQELLQQVDIAVITLGKMGCYIAHKTERVHCPAYPMEPLDSTGAGDAFMGGLSYGILQGWSLKEVGMFANACGAFCATQLGARASGTKEQIEQFIVNHKLH